MRILPLALLLLALPLCAQGKPAPKAKPKAAPTPAVEPTLALVAAPTPAPKPKPRVKLETSYGPVILELEPELAPATVANFLRYVQEGHFAGTIFHRVIPGFMVQGAASRRTFQRNPRTCPFPTRPPPPSRPV